MTITSATSTRSGSDTFVFRECYSRQVTLGIIPGLIPFTEREDALFTTGLTCSTKERWTETRWMSTRARFLMAIRHSLTFQVLRWLRAKSPWDPPGDSAGVLISWGYSTTDSSSSITRPETAWTAQSNFKQGGMRFYGTKTIQEN